MTENTKEEFVKEGKKKALDFGKKNWVPLVVGAIIILLVQALWPLLIIGGLVYLLVRKKKVEEKT